MIETSDDGALNYITGGGIAVRRVSVPAQYDNAIDRYIDGLNARRGAVFSSNYEYPGRYTRWDTAIIDPPIMISARGRMMEIEALNGRGEVMLAFIHEALLGVDDVAVRHAAAAKIILQVAEPALV